MLGLGFTTIWHNDLHVDPEEEGLTHTKAGGKALTPWVSQPTLARSSGGTFAAFESHEVDTVIMRSTDLHSWKRVKVQERCFMPNLFVPHSGVPHVVGAEVQTTTPA